MANRPNFHIYRSLFPTYKERFFHPYQRSQFCRTICYQIDQGVCRRCKRDAQAMHLAIGYVYKKCMDGDWDLNFYAFKMALPKPLRKWPHPLWEADHITPVSLGGTDEINNLRTLCLECHAKVTAELFSKAGQKARLAYRLGDPNNPNDRPMSQIARQVIQNDRQRHSGKYRKKSSPTPPAPPVDFVSD